MNLSVHDAMMSGFACMYFQDPSLLQFQMRMKVDLHRSNLATLFGVKNIPKETQMREIIGNVDSEYFRAIFKAYYLMLQRNKYLADYQLLPPLYLVPMDGTEYFSFKKISCEHCLSKEYSEGEKTYSHQVLQGGIMHPDHPQLGVIFGGDSLFSRQPIIEDILAQKAHYLFVAKPTDHTYLMTLLAFFFHQIFTATDSVYQAARKKFGSKMHLWETLRAYIKIIVFESWEALLQFALTPSQYCLAQAP